MSTKIGDKKSACLSPVECDILNQRDGGERGMACAERKGGLFAVKADITKGGAKIGEISFVDGSLSITCDDAQLKERIYLHLTSPEVRDDEEIRKLEAVKDTEPGTLEYFRAALEFINEMEKDFEFIYHQK
jgi:hypothetical protein